MQYFKKHIAVFLLTLFSVYILPKELLHELCHHEGVEHCTTDVASDGLNFSTIHKHCLLLDHAPEPITYNNLTFDFAPLTFSFLVPVTHYHAPVVFSVEHAPLRGPPVVS